MNIPTTNQWTNNKINFTHSGDRWRVSLDKPVSQSDKCKEFFPVRYFRFSLGTAQKCASVNLGSGSKIINIPQLALI